MFTRGYPLSLKLINEINVKKITQGEKERVVSHDNMIQSCIVIYLIAMIQFYRRKCEKIRRFELEN